MTYPLVRDLAAEGIPVAVACGVLGFSTQGYYRWLAAPVTDRDWDDAHLVNAMFDIHADDPEFGYRFIADELHRLGWQVGENRVQRLCQEHRIWSTTTRKGRRNGKKAGPPVHDDLVERDFAVEELDRLWLTDITEHPTAEGKLYICAVKDACSNRIVGYATGPRMTARLAVAALQLAIVRRGPMGTSGQRDQRRLGTLADDPQGAVTVGDREVIQVGAAGFRDPQRVESDQTRQDVVVAAGQTGRDDAPSSLRSSPIRADSWETLGRRTCIAGESRSSVLRRTSGRSR